MDIKSHLQPLQEWFDKLEKREKYIVTTGAILLTFAIFFAAIWQPVFSSLETERQRYQSQRQLLTWMQETALEINRLKSTGANSADRFKNQSLSSLVALSATSSGVRSFIKKQESDRDNVKVQLEQADFDRLVAWINDMQKKYAIQASKIRVEAEDKPGAVRAQVTLERPDS